MSQVVAIPEPEIDRWPDPPRLLVEWSSPWEDFKSAWRPALQRSPKALAGEAPVGIFPYRGILAAWLLECLLIILVIVLPGELATLRPAVPPPLQKWDVIYYSGDELPQTADRGGAESGASGRSGGRQARHRTQTIRVARGDQPSEKVVDAPNIKLPHSDAAVANLLAFKPTPGPPPVEGARSAIAAPLTNPIPPTPELQAQANRAQSLNQLVAPPAPDVARSNSRTSPALNPTLVAPAPDVTASKTRSSNALQQSVVAPAQDVTSARTRSSNPLQQSVVAPEQDVARDLASSRTSLSQTANVVAPPVSAPIRDSSSMAKLSLPQQAVIAPPPSQVSRDLNSWGRTNSGNIRSQPVAPPPSDIGGSAAGSRSGSSRSAGGAGMNAQVVPPPASLGGQGNESSASGGIAGGRSNGTQLASAAVVPPPPGLGGGKELSGSGRGNKGKGTGSPLDMGSAVAPPANAGGNSAGQGVVMSSSPGKAVGVPNSSGGAIAMSPTGTSTTGLGGAGGGSGIGHGNGGSGSGLTGTGSGAGRTGIGKGSDPTAHGGISPYPGQGGTGNGASNPAMPNTSIEGGTTTVNLPSFGTDGEGDLRNGPGHSSVKDRGALGYTVKATSGSGGVFARYGQLKGDNYSIYIDTSLGTAVMQYVDSDSTTRSYAVDLTAPVPIRDELPQGLHPARVVFACLLSRDGELKNLRVLESESPIATSKILAALHNWKFRPAFRGDEPVEVNAFLGFGVDTR
ncbi:MAG TPA: hypothetical protein VL983_05375 [Terriglobales bacterium]|nr:hypothetical protein [Terriglobales bacterium]